MASSDPLILGFDTSAAHCAAALLRGSTLLAKTQEDMSRGQAERLMGLIEDLLTGQGMTWSDLSAIGVGVGPGNFTGIRISVSAARGMALPLGIPVYGINGFEQRALLSDGPVGIPAPRDQIYMERGNGPELLAATDDHPIAPQPAPADLAEAIAHLALARYPAAAPPPAPLYVRPADAAPPRDKPPVILDDA